MGGGKKRDEAKHVAFIYKWHAFKTRNKKNMGQKKPRCCLFPSHIISFSYFSRAAGPSHGTQMANKTSEPI